jgi:hypothetical protein
MKLHISGDGTYLALIDTAKYKGFVGPLWSKIPRLLEPHFIEHMKNYIGLFWDTNLETNWVIEVMTEKVTTSGFREITGSVTVTNGFLAVLEYNALTNLAQFEKYTIEKYIKENVIPLENGNYTIRVIQLKDPESNFPDNIETNFIFEIIRSETLLPPWTEVPWSKL